jgi:hypothetical protein
LTGTQALVQMKTRGLDIKVLGAFANWDYHAAALVAQPGITSVAELVNKGTDCTIGEVPGSSLYGYALGVEKALNVNCKLVGFGSSPVMIAGFKSGAVDAMVANALEAAQLQSGGTPSNLLIDPFTVLKSIGQKVVPVEFPFWTIGGVSSTLKAKRPLVIRFLQAIRDANALAATMTPAQLAATAVQWKPAFAATKVSDLEKGYDLVKPVMVSGPTAGRIAAKDWPRVLTALTFWELPGISGSDPNIQYGTMVDNSYFDATKPVPTCKPGQKATVQKTCLVAAKHKVVKKPVPAKKKHKRKA